MAVHQITISNDTTFFGGNGVVNWNEANWNAFNWGGALDMVTNVAKLIAILRKQVSKLTGSEMTTSSGPSSEKVKDGNGWYHTFVSATDEGESREFADWSPRTDDGASWVEATVTTTWS
jgi:hypothetical protein